MDPEKGHNDDQRAGRLFSENRLRVEVVQPGWEKAQEDLEQPSSP